MSQLLSTALSALSAVPLVSARVHRAHQPLTQLEHGDESVEEHVTATAGVPPSPHSDVMDGVQPGAANVMKPTGSFPYASMTATTS